MKNYVLNHKVSLMFIALMLCIIVTVSTFFAVCPKKHISYIDVSKDGYCSDILKSYDNGTDITSYKNVSKMSSIQIDKDNRNKFYVYCLSLNGNPLSTKNFRIVEKADMEEKFLMEMYLSSNLILNDKSLQLMEFNANSKFITVPSYPNGVTEVNREKAVYFECTTSADIITTYQNLIIAPKNSLFDSRNVSLRKEIYMELLVIVYHKPGVEIVLYTP